MSGLSMTMRYTDFGASRFYQKVAAQFSNLFPLMDAIGAEVQDQTLERFDTNIGPDGTPWPPSIRVQQAQGQAKTLVQRGHLRSSITRESGSYFTRVGTNVIYALIHQLGGVAGRGGATELPARPYLGLSPQNNTSILNVVDDFWRRVGVPAQ